VQSYVSCYTSFKFVPDWHHGREHDRACHLQTAWLWHSTFNQAHVLISSLTGMGIAINMVKVIESYQTPQAPNLYWH